MSWWADAVDPLLVQRLLRRKARPGLSQPALAQRIHARHHALVGRSALAERLAARGRLVGDPEVPIVDALRTRADTPHATPGSMASATSSRGAAAPSRSIVAVVNRTSAPVIQRKAVSGLAERAATGPASWAADPFERINLGTTPTQHRVVASTTATARPSRVPSTLDAGIAGRSDPTREDGRGVQPGAPSPRPTAVAAAGPPSSAADLSVADVVQSGARQAHAWAPTARPPVAGDPKRASAPALELSTPRPVVSARRAAPVVTPEAEAASPGESLKVLPVVAELVPAGARPGAVIPHQPVRAIPMTWRAPANALTEGRWPQGQPASAVSPPADGVRTPEPRLGPQGQQQRQQQQQQQGAAPVPVDVDRLADVVQTRLLRRLAIERERRGALR